jgi:hypothetical protein
MQSFLHKVLALAGILSGMMMLVFLQADGTTDAFYRRFTTPRQHSLIIGTSRAAQGLQPQIINSKLGGDTSLTEGGLFNYAFTAANSPYGPVYTKSIQRKLTKDGYAGRFVLSVSPLSLSSLCDSLYCFRENNLFLDKLEFVAVSPNVEYLVTSYGKPMIELLTRNDSSIYLHEDGWLEVSVDMKPQKIADRTQRKMDHYRNTLPSYKLSETRLESLKELIAYLQNRGEVYLVRLPISDEMMNLEDEFFPDFDRMMEDLSTRYQVPYFNFTSSNEDYIYTDGNHLWKGSGAEVSRQLGDSILRYGK